MVTDRKRNGGWYWRELVIWNLNLSTLVKQPLPNRTMAWWSWTSGLGCLIITYFMGPGGRSDESVSSWRHVRKHRPFGENWRSGFLNLNREAKLRTSENLCLDKQLSNVMVQSIIRETMNLIANVGIYFAHKALERMDYETRFGNSNRCDKGLWILRGDFLGTVGLHVILLAK